MPSALTTAIVMCFSLFCGAFLCAIATQVPSTLLPIWMPNLNQLAQKTISWGQQHEIMFLVTKSNLKKDSTLTPTSACLVCEIRTLRTLTARGWHVQISRLIK